MRTLFYFSVILAQISSASPARAMSCQRKLGYSGTKETIEILPTGQAAGEYVLTGNLRRFLSTRYGDSVYNLEGKRGALLPSPSTNQGFVIKPTRLHCNFDVNRLGDCYFSDNQVVVTGTADKKDYTLDGLDSTTSRISISRETVESANGVKTERWGIDFNLFPARPSVTEIGETFAFGTCD